LTNKLIENFLSKDFNFPDGRLEEIKFEEIFNLETVLKFLLLNYALISSENALKLIMEYYNNFNLIERGEAENNFFYGMPLRKSLDSLLKSRLKYS